MSDYRAYQLPPDPKPRQVARAPGSGPMIERTKPAGPIPALPTPSQTLAVQLAAANETIGILRDLLNATAATLSKLAETITVDTGQAAVRGAIRADEMRRFQ